MTTRRGPWNSLDARKIEVDASGFSGTLSATDTDVQTALATIDALSLTGGGISLDTTNFDGILSASEDTVQKAMDVIDDIALDAIVSGSASATITADGLDITDGTDTVSINLDSGDVKIYNDKDAGKIILQADNNVPSTTTMASFDPVGASSLYYNGTLTLSTTAAGVSITDGTATAATIGFTEDDLYIINNDPDGQIYMQARNTGNTATNTVFRGDPDGSSIMYYQGDGVITTASTGAAIVSPNDSNTIDFISIAGAVTIASRYDGGTITIEGDHVADGSQAIMFVGDPDGAATLYYAGAAKFSTDTDGIAMVDAGKIVWDQAPASDQTGTGDQVNSETVDQNTVGIGGLLVLSADGNWDDADKDSESTVGRLAIALESGTGSKKLLFRGFFRDDSWNWTPGQQLFVGDSGAITNDVSGYATGDFVQVVGYAKTADIIWFEPSPDYIEVA